MKKFRIEPHRVRLITHTVNGVIVTTTLTCTTRYEILANKKESFNPEKLAVTTLDINQLHPGFENINNFVAIDFTFYVDSLQNVFTNINDALSTNTASQLDSTGQKYLTSLINTQAAYTLRLAHEKLRELVQDDLMQGFVDNESYENLDIVNKSLRDYDGQVLSAEDLTGDPASYFWVTCDFSDPFTRDIHPLEFHYEVFQDHKDPDRWLSRDTTDHVCAVNYMQGTDIEEHKTHIKQQIQTLIDQAFSDHDILNTWCVTITLPATERPDPEECSLIVNLLPQHKDLDQLTTESLSAAAMLVKDLMDKFVEEQFDKNRASIL